MHWSETSKSGIICKSKYSYSNQPKEILYISRAVFQTTFNNVFLHLSFQQCATCWGTMWVQISAMKMALPPFIRWDYMTVCLLFSFTLICLSQPKKSIQNGILKIPVTVFWSETGALMILFLRMTKSPCFALMGLWSSSKTKGFYSFKTFINPLQPLMTLPLSLKYN